MSPEKKFVRNFPLYGPDLWNILLRMWDGLLTGVSFTVRSENTSTRKLFILQFQFGVNNGAQVSLRCYQNEYHLKRWKTENVVAQAYLIWKAPGKYPSVALTGDLLILKWEIWPFSVERYNQKGTNKVHFDPIFPNVGTWSICEMVMLSLFSILLQLPVGQSVTKKEHFVFEFFCHRLLPMIVPLPLLIFVRCLAYWDNAARAVVLDTAHVKALKFKAFCDSDHQWVRISCENSSDKVLFSNDREKKMHRVWISSQKAQRVYFGPITGLGRKDWKDPSWKNVLRDMWLMCLNP